MVSQFCPTFKPVHDKAPFFSDFFSADGAQNNELLSQLFNCKIALTTD